MKHSLGIQNGEQLLLLRPGGSRAGVLGAIIQNWTVGAISVFLCEKFLNTIVCYRKQLPFGGQGSPAPWIRPDSDYPLHYMALYYNLSMKNCIQMF